MKKVLLILISLIFSTIWLNLNGSKVYSVSLNAKNQLDTEATSQLLVMYADGVTNISTFDTTISDKVGKQKKINAKVELINIKKGNDIDKLIIDFKKDKSIKYGKKYYN